MNSDFVDWKQRGLSIGSIQSLESETTTRGKGVTKAEKKVYKNLLDDWTK